MLLWICVSNANSGSVYGDSNSFLESETLFSSVLKNKKLVLLHIFENELNLVLFMEIKTYSDSVFEELSWFYLDGILVKLHLHAGWLVKGGSLKVRNFKTV